MSIQKASLNADEEALLSSIHDDATNSSQWFKSARKYYKFPLIRVSVILRIFLLCDLVCLATLWLTARDDCNVELSITNYTFTGSVFDLIVISLVKWILLLVLLDCADRWALSDKDLAPGVSVPHRTNVTLAISALVITASLIYSLIKLTLIILEPSFGCLCQQYQVLVILSPALFFLENAFTLWIYCTMQSQLRSVNKYIINSEGRQLDEQGTVIEKNASLRRLFSLISYKEGTLIGGGISCLIVTSATSIAAPYFFGQVVDAAQKSMASLNRMILILFLIYLVYGIAGMFRAWLFELSGQKLVARMRVELFSAILRQDIHFFDTTRTGELTNRLASDTEVIQNAITVNVSMLLRNLINVTGSLVVMFWLDPTLTGILLAVVPIISIGAVQYGKFVKKLRTSFQDRLADASSIAEESVSSIRTVKAFNGELKTRLSYEKEIMRSYDVAKKLAMSTGIFSGWVSIAAFGAICLAMWYGGKLVFEGQLSVGILTSFLVYTVTIAANLAVISSLYGEFMQAVGASERMFNIIDKEATVVTRDPFYPDQFTPLIEFRDVHFRYPSRNDYEVLKGIDLSVKPGHVVALVGPSGGGKSTIVSLIERFYDCNSGEILISGMNIRHLDPLWFRSRVSLVCQEPTLFACSIKENIAYGTEASDQQIREAARQANAESFIDSFPDGFDTLVGERGVRLSGGQKQRVAIARSLILQPAILLLDEATSALDAESERLVQEAIDRATKDRTVLVIAHRLSTVRHADQVVVIDNGKIAERGTHDELVNQDGVYRRLVLKQLEAGSPSPFGTSGQTQSEQV